MSFRSLTERRWTRGRAGDITDFYGIQIRTKKSPNGMVEVQPFPVESTQKVFRIKESAIQRLKPTRGITSFSDKPSSTVTPVNQIELNDVTPFALIKQRRSPIASLFCEELTDEVTPTVVKITVSGRVKRFLIYVPPLLNISTLSRIYGPALVKLQSDFYRKRMIEYRGASA